MWVDCQNRKFSKLMSWKCRKLAEVQFFSDLTLKCNSNCDKRFKVRYRFGTKVRPEWNSFSGWNFNHVSVLIYRVELPNDGRGLEAVLDHVERGESDDFGQARLWHVDVHSNVVTTEITILLDVPFHNSFYWNLRDLMWSLNHLCHNQIKITWGLTHLIIVGYLFLAYFCQYF